MSDFPKKGDIFWVNLEPTQGAETKKIRPCLIISGNIGNQHSPLVIVAPLTTKVHKIYPFEVKISVDGKPCKVMLNQARSIDKSRLGKKIGSTHLETLRQVDKAIKIVYDIT